MKYIVAFFISLVLLTPSLAQSAGLKYGQNAHLDELFAALQSNDGQDAESEILLIFRQSGSDAMDLLLKRGFDAVDKGAFADAAWHFSALIDHAPDFAEAYYGRATAFYELNELGLAMQDLKMALSLNPRHFIVLIGIGGLQEELGNTEAALVAFKLSLSLNPHNEWLEETIETFESHFSVLH